MGNCSLFIHNLRSSDVFTLSSFVLCHPCKHAGYSEARNGAQYKERH